MNFLSNWLSLWKIFPRKKCSCDQPLVEDEEKEEEEEDNWFF